MEIIYLIPCSNEFNLTDPASTGVKAVLQGSSLRALGQINEKGKPQTFLVLSHLTSLTQVSTSFRLIQTTTTGVKSGLDKEAVLD